MTAENSLLCQNRNNNKKYNNNNIRKQNAGSVSVLNVNVFISMSLRELIKYYNNCILHKLTFINIFLKKKFTKSFICWHPSMKYMRSMQFEVKEQQ